MEEERVELCQAPYQSIKEEEWLEMHEKLQEVTKKIGVMLGGHKVADLGKVAWRKTSKESFFAAEVEQERAFNRRSAVREAALPVGEWTCIKC